MKIFKKISIRARISLVIVAVSLLILGLATIIETVVYIHDLKTSLLQIGKLEAKLIGDCCLAPYALNNKKRTEEVLKRTEALHHIQNAHFYDTNLTLVASYDAVVYDDVDLSGGFEKRSWFKDDYLYIFSPIIYKDNIFGVIHLRLITGIKDIYVRRVWLAILLAITMLVLSILLALGFQRIVSEPVLNLTKAVEKITSSQNYSLRVKKQSDDEIGALYERFNHMLDVIQNHKAIKDRALSDLEESRERLKAIINNSPAVIYMKDVEGKYILANKKYEELHGEELGCIIGKTDYDIYSREIADKLVMTDQKVFSEKTSLLFEEHIPFNAETHTFLSVKFPIYDSKQEIIAICAIFTDITKRKQAEIELENYKDHLEDLVKLRTKELQRANSELIITNEKLNSQKNELEIALNKLKQAQAQLVQSEKMASIGVLTAGIAHEINNPINYISSGIEGLKLSMEDFTEIIEKYSTVNEKNIKEKLQEIEDYKKEIDYEDLMRGIKKITGNIQTGVERTTEIIKGLRFFSNRSENKIVLMDLHEGINSSLLMLYSQYKRRIEVIKDYGNLPKISCYSGKINQVFMNLLSNAIQAIPDEGKIFIKTRPCSLRVNDVDDTNSFESIIKNINDKVQSIAISIKDTGLGIPGEIIENIFEPFFTTKEVGKGTGLGLSITYNIIHEHKGKIFVNSNVGIGTEFILVLPTDL